MDEITELLDKLQQIQKRLKDVDSARMMVDKTVHAYQDGSEQLKAYSEQLGLVSNQISGFAEQIKQNRDNLFSEVDERIKNSALKMERTTEAFAAKTNELVSLFEQSTRSKVNELNATVDRLVNDANIKISQMLEEGKNAQSKSSAALDLATSSFYQSTNNLLPKNEFYYSTNKIENKITIFSIIVIVITLINIAISVVLL